MFMMIRTLFEAPVIDICMQVHSPTILCQKLSIINSAQDQFAVQIVRNAARHVSDEFPLLAIRKVVLGQSSSLNKVLMELVFQEHHFIVLNALMNRVSSICAEGFFASDFGLPVATKTYVVGMCSPHHPDWRINKVFFSLL